MGHLDRLPLVEEAAEVLGGEDQVLALAGPQLPQQFLVAPQGTILVTRCSSRCARAEWYLATEGY